METPLAVISFVILFAIMASTGGYPWGSLIFIILVGNALGIPAFRDYAFEMKTSAIMATICSVVAWALMRLLACGIMNAPFFPLQSCM